MNKHILQRSAAYPAINIEESIILVEKLKASLGTGPFDRGTAAIAIGYRGVNGRSSSKIAALVHYGLLNRQGNSYKLSLLSEQILYSTSEIEKEAAIVEAVKTPKLFNSLIDRFKNSAVPILLVNILVRDYNISDKVAKQVVEDFRSSVDFAGLLKNGIILENKELVNKLSEAQSSEESVETKSDSYKKKTEPIGLSNYNEVPLPSGIIISFPKEMSFEVTLGTFGNPIKQLEEIAQQVISNSKKSQLVKNEISDSVNQEG